MASKDLYMASKLGLMNSISFLGLSVNFRSFRIDLPIGVRRGLFMFRPTVNCFVFQREAVDGNGNGLNVLLSDGTQLYANSYYGALIEENDRWIQVYGGTNVLGSIVSADGDLNITLVSDLRDWTITQVYP